MKTITSMFMAFILFGGWIFGAVTSDDYGQTYVIFMNGARAGKEIVTESVAENGDRLAQTENEIYITDGLETNRMAFTTRLILDGKTMKPKSYKHRYVSGNSGDHYEVEAEGSTITRTLTRAGETSVATVELLPDFVILDLYVYHQYDYLIPKYDEKKGGRQIFSDFLPVIGDYIQVALTRLGDLNLQSSEGEIKAQEYQVEFVGLRNGTLMTDDNGRLLQLVMPDQDLEVVREDLVPANR
ncbi:MAG: hypothetical protein P8Z37_04170 [Acidobacteriota bacterium]